MRSGNNFIVFVSFVLLLIVLSSIYLTRPQIIISLNGKETVDLNLGEEYIEEGINAKYKRIGLEKDIPYEIINNVNTNEIGQYQIIYETKYKKLSKTIKRNVNVLDLAKPTISISKPIYACKSTNLVNLNATAIDNYDGDITNNIKYKINDDTINIYVEDSSHNKTEIDEKIEYIDSQKPIIKLKGNSIVYLKLGTNYKDEGAAATDSCDGDITNNIKVTGNVDYNIEGEYIITYSISDSVNNEVSVNRKIIVYKDEDTPKVDSTNSIIYLTFDDGPGVYTERILSILSDNNIKATFFVTNQFPKYQYLIKKEYDEGHTVGLHTYSHKWSIYDNVDSYLNDFNKIQDIVINQTGVTPKYFRFPGGTSNHVAKISMANLANIMKEKGYVYFDWNIDSGDTHKKNTKDYIVNMVKKNLKGSGEYIILMHDIKKNTMEALPDIIKYAKSKGYTFKAIDESTTPKQFKAYK